MTEHKIYVRRDVIQRLSVPLIKRSIRAALRLEGVYQPCEVSVLVTNDVGIQALNRRFRCKDSPTDVLSFPMQELIPGEFTAEENAVNRDTGLLPLGDIILSYDRVLEQAKRYGHTKEREAAYLTVHSVLHLLGYDHMDEGAEKARMRAREELIIEEVGRGYGKKFSKRFQRVSRGG